MGLDKGIRVTTTNVFLEMLPQRATLGNTGFRKAVISWVAEAFDISIGSASSHYAYSFNLTKKNNPELVEGLGRPEGKNNGGRKAKSKVPPVMLLLGYSPRKEYVEEEQTVFNVCAKKTGAVVAEALSFEAARAMVNKNAAQKKAKLYFV